MTEEIKCPKCGKANLREQVSIKGFIVKKKIIIFYCPLCEFKKESVFTLSELDVQFEAKEREYKPKHIINEYKSDKIERRYQTR